MRGLYAIADTAALARRGLDTLAFARALLAAQPAALQLRDKRGGAREMLALLRELAPEARAAGVPLFSNDRADLAILAGADGVHLGQRDLPPSAARAISGELLLGMSVHDEEELARALAEPLDYIALGAVFATASKERSEPLLGLDGLARLAARARARFSGPLVAIGGIDLDSAAAAGATCDAVAAIGALVPPADVASPYAWAQERARLFSAAVAC